MRRLLALLLAVVIIVASVITALQLLPSLNTNSNQNPPGDFHFGVSCGGNTTAQAKLLIDRVKNFTNLFVSPIRARKRQRNSPKRNRRLRRRLRVSCDCLLRFFRANETWQVPWLSYAQQRWGSSFLGVYMHDEPGGVTLDANWTGYFEQLSIRNSSINYEHQPAIDLALNGTLPLDSYQLNQTAYHFNTELQSDPNLIQLKNRQIHSYTSDYALYWFDYKGGYDTIFAELGSNQSTTQTIALARGAANMQNKTWGTIITWTYNQPPYLVNGSVMYSQLLLSYMAGAQYAVIFDYPQVGDNPYGVLTEDHFAAMERFWKDIQSASFDGAAKAAYVLPYAYGWGMRSENDSIWGLWPPDNSSAQIWSNMQTLLSKYSIGLDIVYDDPEFPIDGRYSQVYWWNQTL